MKSINGVFALAMLAAVSTAQAGEYLGLGLGEQMRDQVISTLKASGARFEADYSYKGYGRDLPMIKVASIETASFQSRSTGIPSASEPTSKHR